MVNLHSRTDAVSDKSVREWPANALTDSRKNLGSSVRSRDVPREFRFEPALGVSPVVVGRCDGNAESLGRLVLGSSPAKNRSLTSSAARASIACSLSSDSLKASRSKSGPCNRRRHVSTIPRGNARRQLRGHFFRRAFSTRIRRIASAAAAKKCPRLFQPCAFSTSTSRRYASCTRAVACSVCPGFSWASFAAASFRSSS